MGVQENRCEWMLQRKGTVIGQIEGFTAGRSNG